MALKKRRSDVEAALAHMTPEQIRSQFALVEEEDVENNKRRCRLCGDIYKAKNDTGHGSTTSLRRHAMDSHLQQFLVLFPVPALLPGAQPPPAVLVFCSLIFNTFYVFFFLRMGGKIRHLSEGSPNLTSTARSRCAQRILVPPSIQCALPQRRSSSTAPLRNLTQICFRPTQGSSRPTFCDCGRTKLGPRFSSLFVSPCLR